jgi:DNA repair photolyase
MKIIYQPKGKAAEYADLALNIYNGCTHGCRYCYGPAATHKSISFYHGAASPKFNVLDRVRHDALVLSALWEDFTEILISFLGDPYQLAEMRWGLTREVIKVLTNHDLTFTILTKGGTRILRDFDLLQGYEKFRFGTSLVWFCDDANARQWEPNAASVEDRIHAIRKAKEAGMTTWVSLEPVIIPEHAIELIKRIHPYVDHWKVGKINHNKNIEKNVDWIRFRTQVKDLLNSLGADYYIKKSLADL